MFQQFHLLPNLTALENVSLPLELAKHIDATKIAEQALEEVGLADRCDHFPRQLSGGEQQRVAFARAFCTTPTILFADEPTGNLDEDTAAQIIDLLFSLNQERQTTLILVTHDENLAARCSRTVHLSAGTINES